MVSLCCSIIKFYNLTKCNHCLHSKLSIGKTNCCYNSLAYGTEMLHRKTTKNSEKFTSILQKNSFTKRIVLQQLGPNHE